MESIASRDSKAFKEAVKVRKGKYRDRLFVEGSRLAVEALESKLNVLSAYLSAAFHDDPENTQLISLLEDASDNCFRVKNSLFRSLSDTKNPQGIALLCERPRATLDSIFDRERLEGIDLPLVIYLTRISNPGNLGTILRTAAAAGCAGIVTSPGSTDAYSPAVLRGSMGASFRIPVVERAELSEVHKRAGQAEMKVFLADQNAFGSCWTEDLSQPSMIVLGSEAHGLSDDERNLGGLPITIPISDESESLNLAVSAGILIFEAKRQRITREQ